MKMIFKVKLFPALLMAFLILGGNFVVAASSITDLNKTLDKKQDQREELQNKINVYREIIDIKKKQQNTLNNQISLMDTEIEKLESELDLRKDAINDYNSDIDRLTRQITHKEESIHEQKKILSDLLRRYYENKRQDFLVNLLGNEDLPLLLANGDRLTQMGDKVGEVLKNIQSLKNDLEKERKSLEEKKQETTNLLYQLEDKNSNLESTKDRKEVLLVQTKGEETKYQKLLRNVEEQKREIEREIEELEAGKADQVDFSKLPPEKSGYFTYPVGKGIKITQGYGKTSFAKNHYLSGKHNGVDFGVKYGSVYAAKSGKVTAVGNSGRYAYGKWIAVDHNDGLVTLYAHLNRQLVSKGESVKEGEKIGVSGNTGYSTGPHLHFSVFAEKTFEIVESEKVKGIMIPTGGSINPMRYLK